MCSSITVGISETTRSCEAPSSRTAIARAPIAISTSSCMVRDRVSGSLSMSTRPTAAAVESLSWSHERRKFATEGMKISTSASITNRTVKSRSFVDRPRDKGTARSLRVRIRLFIAVCFGHPI
jgi:hypothetical protein